MMETVWKPVCLPLWRTAGKFKGAVFETKLINEELSTQSMGG